MRSPCVGRCMLNFNLSGLMSESPINSGLCEGCGRTGEEISKWSKMDVDKINRIMPRIKERNKIFKEISDIEVSNNNIDRHLEKKIISIHKLSFDYIPTSPEKIFAGEEKTNVLILDDDANRLESFKKKINDCNLFLSSKVEDCINFLTNNNISVLFLDHDLSGMAFVDSFGPDDTGYTVAKWLVENQKFCPKKIIVHSLSETGRKNIIDKLKEIEDDIEILELPGCWTETSFFMNAVIGGSRNEDSPNRFVETQKED